MHIFTLLLTAEDGNPIQEWVFDEDIDIKSLAVGQEVTQAMHDYDVMMREQDDGC